MNNHHTLMDIIKAIHRLSIDDIQGLANGLTWFSESQAERLKNAIAASQQEQYNSLTAQWDRERTKKRVRSWRMKRHILYHWYFLRWFFTDGCDNSMPIMVENERKN